MKSNLNWTDNTKYVSPATYFNSHLPRTSIATSTVNEMTWSYILHWYHIQPMLKTYSANEQSMNSSPDLALSSYSKNSPFSFEMSLLFTIPALTLFQQCEKSRVVSHGVSLETWTWENHVISLAVKNPHFS